MKFHIPSQETDNSDTFAGSLLYGLKEYEPKNARESTGSTKISWGRILLETKVSRK